MQDYNKVWDNLLERHIWIPKEEDERNFNIKILYSLKGTKKNRFYNKLLKIFEMKNYDIKSNFIRIMNKNKKSDDETIINLLRQSYERSDKKLIKTTDNKLYGDTLLDDYPEAHVISLYHDNNSIDDIRNDTIVLHKLINFLHPKKFHSLLESLTQRHRREIVITGYCIDDNTHSHLYQSLLKTMFSFEKQVVQEPYMKDKMLSLIKLSKLRNILEEKGYTIKKIMNNKKKNPFNMFLIRVSK